MIQTGHGPLPLQAAPEDNFGGNKDFLDFFRQFRTGVPHEQLERLSQQTPVNAGVTLSVVVLIAAFLLVKSPSFWVLAWAGAQVSLLALVFFRWRHARRHRADYQRMDMRASPSGLRHAVAWAAASSALWGSLTLFLPDLPVFLQLGTVLVIGGMAAGASATLSAVPQVAVVFILGCTLPVAARYLALGGSDNLMMALMFLTYTVGMIVTSRIVHNSLINQLRAERRAENYKTGHLLKEIAVVANEATNADDALQKCLDAVCAYTGWPVGHVYFVAGNGDGKLFPSDIWCLKDSRRFTVFQKVSQETYFERGSGLPGRVLESGEPAWIDDVETDDNFPRASMADNIGVRAGFAFPVSVGDAVVAVLEFFSERTAPPDDQILDVMASVGIQIGRSLERQRSSEYLEETARMLRGRLKELEEAHEALERQGRDLRRLNDDLTTAKDRAEAANRAKSDFLATMSHELRTPLNAILGFSEIIRDQLHGPLGDEKYIDNALEIFAAGAKLLALINNILDMVKIDAGKEELREEEIDVAKLLAKVSLRAGDLADEKGAKLALDIAEDLPLLWADKSRLKQVLGNLVANAIKFNKPGGSVTLKVWFGSGGFVLQVIDTGIGIADDDIPKALSQFGQVESSFSRDYEGSGLGLPISRSLVELHGGCLDVQSEIGVGTSVTVRLPANRAVKDLGGSELAPNVESQIAEI